MYQNYIFEITSNISHFPPFHLTQTEIETYLPDTQISTMPSQEFDIIQTEMIHMLKNNSFKITTQQDENQSYIVLKGNHIAKKNYFYPKFKQMTHLLEGFTLSNMIDQSYMKKLQNLCNDTDAPYVYLWGYGLMTLDEFIREFQTETPYYISGIYQIEG